jgi:hypothetical protein
MATFSYRVGTDTWHGGTKTFTENNIVSGHVDAISKSDAESKVRKMYHSHNGRTGDAIRYISINEVKDNRPAPSNSSNNYTPTYSSSSSDAGAGAALIVIPVLAVAATAWLTWQGLKLGYKGVKYLHEQAEQAAAESKRIEDEAKKIEDEKPAYLKELEVKKEKKKKLLAKKQAEEFNQQFNEFLMYFGLTFSAGFAVVMMVFAALKVTHTI